MAILQHGRSRVLTPVRLERGKKEKNRPTKVAVTPSAVPINAGCLDVCESVRVRTALTQQSHDIVPFVLLRADGDGA